MAAEAAPGIVHGFNTSGIHHMTHKATLKRHGSFRQDLNQELLDPLISTIISSWTSVFQTDLFSSFEQEVTEAIQGLLDNVQESAGLQTYSSCEEQIKIAQKEISTSLKELLSKVDAVCQAEQKTISRQLVPHVLDTLRDGYEGSLGFVGKGSVKQRKDYLQNFVENKKDDIFKDGASKVMDSLFNAVQKICTEAQILLLQLAEKVKSE